MTYTLQIFRAVGSPSVTWTILRDDRHAVWHGDATSERQAVLDASETYRRATGSLPVNGLSDHHFIIELLGDAAGAAKYAGRCDN